MRTDRFHLDLILKFGFLTSLAIVGVNLVWYLTKWDFFSLAGLFKILVGTLFLPLAGFVASLYFLMKRQGRANFLQLLVHCILISVLLAVCVSIYWTVFYTIFEPDYYYQVLRSSYEGLIENAKQVQALEVKTEILRQAELYKKQLDDPKAFDLPRLLINELVRYLLIGLLFGSVLGFILSKIRVMQSA